MSTWRRTVGRSVDRASGPIDGGESAKPTAIREGREAGDGGTERPGGLGDIRHSTGLYHGHRRGVATIAVLDMSTAVRLIETEVGVLTSFRSLPWAAFCPFEVSGPPIQP